MALEIYLTRNRQNVWESLRQSGSTFYLTAIRTGDTTCETWRESAEALLDFFFGTYSPLSVEYPPFGNANLPTVELSPEQVADAVKGIRSRKSPGLDGITGSVVKELHKVAPELLLALMQLCLDDGTFSSNWKTAKVIPLLKSSEKPKDKAKSYRPICLLSAWSKVLEKIMVKRLCDDCLNNGASISSTQFGFTEGKSTVDAWKAVVNHVRSCPSKYILGLL